MIKIEKTEVVGWESAIRGMRNPMNSWEKSDTIFYNGDNYWDICGNSGPANKPDDCDMVMGHNDLDLMTRLAVGGSVHAKYRRMIVVYVDITAPLYWWKEFDTYKVGTVANSCSTMHKIQAKKFTWEDFSYEHLIDPREVDIDIFSDWRITPRIVLQHIINSLNRCRELYLQTKDKKYWWQMIQLLPSSYNQRRTVMLNYEVLAGIHPMRKDHKLDEWREFCKWIEGLPYSEIIRES